MALYRKVRVNFQRPVYQLFPLPLIICETYSNPTKMFDDRLRHLSNRSQLIVARRMLLFEFQFGRVCAAKH